MCALLAYAIRYSMCWFNLSTNKWRGYECNFSIKVLIEMHVYGKQLYHSQILHHEKIKAPENKKYTNALIIDC